MEVRPANTVCVLESLVLKVLVLKVGANPLTVETTASKVVAVGVVWVPHALSRNLSLLHWLGEYR